MSGQCTKLFLHDSNKSKKCFWVAVAEGIEGLSSNLKVGSSIPLSKMLNLKLCLLEQQSAANRCTV